MTSFIVSDHVSPSPRHEGVLITPSDFMKACQAEGGIDYNTLYIDVNAIDKELYETFVSKKGVVFFRDRADCPAYINTSVENWSPDEPFDLNKSSQESGSFHKFVLNSRLRPFLILLTVSLLLSTMVNSAQGAIPGIAQIILNTILPLIILFSIAALVMGVFFRIVRTTERVGSRCPSCKKWGAIEEGRQEILSQKAISVKVPIENKDRYGNVTGRSEQYIPGTRTHLRQWYTCKKCKTRYYRDSSIDTADL